MASERAIALIMCFWVLVVGGFFIYGMLHDAFKRERS